MIGQTVSHYRITSRIGRGGMGVVYRAQDLKLGRHVALKFLPAEHGIDPLARERLLREARTAAALDHANICTIYDVDETADGQLFIAMKLYEERTLQARLAEGALPVPEALEIAAQAAEGLGAAHRQGIVHRDIKPSNLLVDAGVVKILDFGLALLKGSTRLTIEGTLVGTIAYMAPEMARAERGGPASDVWSLGVVLHEMLGGRNPFLRASMQATLRAIDADDPGPPARAGDALPGGLADVLARALAKDPEQRYPDASALAEALRKVQRDAGLPAGAPEKSTVFIFKELPRARPRLVWRMALGLAALGLIAYAAGEACRDDDSRVKVGVLLPMTTATGGAVSDWPRLVQSMIVEGLAGAQEFVVLDAQSLNGRLARDLGAASPARGAALFRELQGARISQVVDASIDPSGGGQRIAISLLEVPSGEILFTEHRVVAAESELAGTVSALAASVMGFLQVRVLNRDIERDLRPYLAGSKNSEAIKAFMQAAQYVFRAEPGALRYHRRALDIDPGFIAPRLWLIAGLAPAGRLDEARALLAELRELEQKASPFEQAMIDWAAAHIDDNQADAARNLEIALRFAPGNNILLFNLGAVRIEMGDYPGAVAALEPAVKAGFRYPECRVMLAAARIHLGQLDQARQDLEGGLESHPVSINTYGLLEALSLAGGDAAGAARFNALAVTRWAAMPEPARTAGPPATTLAENWERIAEECEASGRPERALAVLERAVQYERDSADHQAALSGAYRRDGQLERAAAAASAGLTLEPGSAPANLALARALDTSGDHDGAVARYRRFLGLDPNAKEVPEVRARLAEIEGGGAKSRK